MGCFTSSAGAGCCAYIGDMWCAGCHVPGPWAGARRARSVLLPAAAARSTAGQAHLQTRRRSGARVLWLERRYLRPWAPCGSGGVEQRPSARSTRALGRPLECDAEVTSREYSSAAPARALRPGAGLLTSLAGASWACGLRSAVSGTCGACRRARRASSVSPPSTSAAPRAPVAATREATAHKRGCSAGGAEPGFSG